MSEWKEITIGDLGRVVTGNTPPKKDPDNYNGVYPFIKPTDMTIGLRHVEEWEENYSEKAYQKYKNSYIPPGSTGVVTIGTVGEKIFQSDRWCFTNQSVNVVIPNRSKYDPDFIYHLLKLNLPKVENANPGTASGRHHVSKSNFCAIKVKAPDLSSQKKIASILSAYDDLIENNLKRIKLLEEKAQLTYEEWFVRMKYPGHENDVVDSETELPLGWCISDVNSILGKLPSKTKVKKSEILDVGLYPVIDQSRDFISGYTNEASSVYKACTVNPIIVFGDHTRVLKLIQFDFSRGADGTQLITSCKDEIPNYFLYLTLSQIDLSNYSYARHFKYLKIEEVVIPDAPIIQRFEELVIPVFKTCHKLREINRLLISARDLLLPRLMSGMIDIDEIKYNYPKETLA